jgi:uncharacterized repeat protein (TIGR03803 family)
MRKTLLVRVAASLAFAIVASIATAQIIKPIYTFTNSPSSPPRNPRGDLVLGPDGNLYGTTPYGGIGFGGQGTVFRLTLPGTVTILTTFPSSGALGRTPHDGLALGPDGNFYGTTFSGGSGAVGTIFRVTTNGVLTSLYSFTTGSHNGSYWTNSDGGSPYATLTLGIDGCFYGGTTDRGPNGTGTLFKMTTNGVFSTLFAFSPMIGNSATNTTGAELYAHMTLGPDGSLYGTTYLGGAAAGGTAFRLSTDGDFAVLANFVGTNGSEPNAPLTLGPDGNFYGTTVNGGIFGDEGTVFRLTTNGVLTTILSFNYDTPAAPQAGVAFGPDGNLYGTTSSSSSTESNAWGSVFRLTTDGVLTTLANFAYTNGVDPEAGLTLGPDGYFYGTANYGGTSDPSTAGGVVYRLNLGTPFTNPKPGISIRRLPDGTAMLSVTNTPGSMNRLWTTTDLSLPMSSWQVLSTNVATNGFFQVTVTNTSGDRVRYYRVSTP